MVSVKKVVMDFERALWGAVKTRLPHVEVMGCVFHWTQALWRKVSNEKSSIFGVNSPTARSQSTSC